MLSLSTFYAYIILLGESMVKFKNINLVTFIAMFMIINIHYFNNFHGYVSEGTANTVMLILRGFALPAVIVYLTNTAFTSFYMQKGVNYRSLYLFIIIPTLLFAQLQHMLFDQPAAAYTFAKGFSGSWFGEMYVYVMLLVPLFLYLDLKGGIYRVLLLGYSIVFVIAGYGYSIATHDATANNLGVAMMFPYIAMVYLLYRVIQFVVSKIDYIEKSWMVKAILVLIIIICGYFEAQSYNGFFVNGAIGKSYFSPFTIIFSLSLWTLIYSLDLSKMPEIRVITRASYFLYFTHWIIIRAFLIYFPDFPANHVWLGLGITIVLAYVLAIITFELYTFIAVKLLRL